MLTKMENEAMAAIRRGQESVNTLKMLTDRSADPTVEAHLDSILHSFSLLSIFLHSLKSNSTAQQSLNKKSSRDDDEEERKGSVFHTVDSPTPILDDGFGWRKYGQKTIKGSLYQRTVYNGPHLCQSSVFLYSTNNGTHSATKVFRFDNRDQSIAHSKLPLFVSVDPVEAVDQTRDEDFEDFLLNPEQFWLPEFSYLPGEDAMFS